MTLPLLKAGDTIVIATHNKGKLAEFQAELSKAGLKAVSLADFTSESPEETASTFEGNAKIKALAAARATGLPSLADDSGFCLEALEGRPGLFSARFITECKSLENAFQTLDQQIKDSKTPENKKAGFTAALCLAFPDGQAKTLKGECHGHFTYPPRGDKGHGYDPVFVPEGFDYTFAEMEEAQKNSLSHRGRALEKFFKECVAS